MPRVLVCVRDGLVRVAAGFARVQLLLVAIPGSHVCVRGVQQRVHGLLMHVPGFHAQEKLRLAMEDAFLVWCPGAVGRQ